ncbi:hypothetical protein TRICI_005722 [Trichomonascus ciferrii]|uniref:Uncharacterized protein n=1 Tax=Trichomonascus ciferrii TaxID=44093 RepID=A0A642UUS0_9ASCO|nr:hypothetical protein TRICI_005722 [Trichomonascus ciferrii]
MVFIKASTFLSFLATSTVLVQSAPLGTEPALQNHDKRSPQWVEHYDDLRPAGSKPERRPTSIEELREGATSGEDEQGKYTEFADGKQVHYNDFMLPNFEEITKDDPGQSPDVDSSSGQDTGSGDQSDMGSNDQSDMGSSDQSDGMGSTGADTESTGGDMSGQYA